MGKIGAYQPPAKYKNYSLPTPKPLRSHAFYKEKVWTLQEQIYIKLKKLTELLESLYPKLTDSSSKKINVVIKKNIEILVNDLNLIKNGLLKNSELFNSNKLKINKKYIEEMKEVCDTLQTIKSYEYEVKNLIKIKHTLHELEHLIQPSFERSLEKARVKSKPEKKVPVVESKKKIKEDTLVKPKKKKAISKTDKPKTTLPKLTKVESKQRKKPATPVQNFKPSEKTTKSKPKLPTKTIKQKSAAKTKKLS